MGTNQLNGFINVNSVVLKKNSHKTVEKELEEPIVIGKTFRDLNPEFVELYKYYSKRRLFISLIGIVVFAILLIVGIGAKIPLLIPFSFVGVIFTLGSFMFFTNKLNNLQPTKIISYVSRVNYPIIVQKTKKGLVFLDGLNRFKENYTFSNYVDNNIIVKSILSSSNSFDNYEKLIFSNSINQKNLINQLPERDIIKENKIIEINVENNLRNLSVATGTNNLKKYSLNVPILTKSNPTVISLQHLLRNTDNTTVSKKTIEPVNLQSELKKEKSISMIEPSEITDWIEGLESWATEAVGQDIVEFTMNLSKIIRTSSENITSILNGLNKLIQITLPSSRIFYQDFSNLVLCKKCVIPMLEENYKRINLHNFIKERLLIGVLDDPIFHPDLSIIESDGAKKIVNSMIDERKNVEEVFNEHFPNTPFVYSLFIIDNKLPYVTREKVPESGEMHYSCHKCGFVSEIVTVSRYIKPTSIAYAVNFSENLDHMENRGDTIIRNLNSFKTAKQQRQTSLKSLEAEKMKAYKNFVKARAKYDASLQKQVLFDGM